MIQVDVYSHELRGCTPEPLMSYLKALGILRLVSEQKDPSARGWWRNDGFFLRTTLGRDALVEFFLNEYRPTPIVSPWNGAGGFFPSSSSKSKSAVGAVESSGSGRLEAYRQTIRSIRRILEREKITRKPAETEKASLLARCRGQLSDEAVSWLDAVFAFSGDEPKFMPLLGTGANDGNMDFTCNFMTNLVPALTGVDIGKAPSKRDCPNERRSGWLQRSVFDEGSGRLARAAVGQFNPGGVGGYNAGVGFEASSLLNPWDYVLMMEGTLLFAGAAARRLSAQASSKTAFPFTVENSVAVSGAFEYGETSRAEFWAPLWGRPATLKELEHLMFEGRAQLGRRQVTSGTDFARAVAGLGTERGVDQFQRFGFLERYGRTYLAAPLGRFRVRRDQGAARRANVLFDLNGWMDSMRRNLSNSPAGLDAALGGIEGAIFEFCQEGREEALQKVLVAVGEAERWLSKSGLRKDNEKGKGVRPLNMLSRGWLKHANDGSREFRLARALASILPESADGKERVGPIRENLEPVKVAGRTAWHESSVSHVWAAGAPLANMRAVLERRCLEGRMQGLKESENPPLHSEYAASPGDIAAFLDGEVDVQRMVDLALPLSFLSYRPPKQDSRSPGKAPLRMSAVYAAMKLTLLPGEFKWPKYGIKVKIRMEPQMLAMLRAGRVGDAYEVARRRLWASGLRPLLDVPGIADRSDYVQRIAAALLFPIDDSAAIALAEYALWQPNPTDSQEVQSI